MTDASQPARPPYPDVPEWLDAETASDVVGSSFVLSSRIMALGPGQRVAGAACTALAARDDNGVVQEVLRRQPGGGDVLVVAGASESRHAIIGDLTSRELMAIGFRALVTDGPVRDAAELVRLPLQVWSGGTTVLASGKDQPGHIGVPIPIGGVIVNPGDIIIASSGGVVVWPRNAFGELLTAARAKHEKDMARLTLLEGT